MTKRRKILTFTPVYALNSKDLLGYLGDLTLKGGLMISEKPLEANQTLDVDIEFRIAPEIQPSDVAVAARVAWCKLEDHRTYYNTGLEFLSVSDEDKNVIETVLEKYQIDPNKPK